MRKVTRYRGGKSLHWWSARQLNRLKEIDNDLHKTIEDLQLNLKMVLTEISANHSENINWLGALFPILSTMQTRSTDILEHVLGIRDETRILMEAQVSNKGQLDQLRCLHDDYL